MRSRWADTVARRWRLSAGGLSRRMPPAVLRRVFFLSAWRPTRQFPSQRKFPGARGGDFECSGEPSFQGPSVQGKTVMFCSILSHPWQRQTSTSETRKRQRKRRRPGFESLEERRLLVVGAFSPPDPLPPASFSGVVQLTHNKSGGNNTACSGTLLTSGRHILTAAHCLTNGNGTIDSFSTTVRFLTPSGSYPLTVAAAQYQVHPSWNGSGDSNYGYDLAILNLPEIAPSDATRYDIYRSSDEVGKTVSIVGYGRTGTGDRGANIAADGQRRRAWNRIEGTSYDNWYQSGTGGPDGKVLWYDFDGTLGQLEGFAAPGDSGGPLFIGNRIAGITSAGFETRFLGGSPEFEFGEDASTTRVSAFADWIDMWTQMPRQIVLNMSNQPAGDDGVADTIEMRDDGSGNVQILIGGTVVSNATVFAMFAGLQLNGSSDDERFVMDFSITPITIRGGAGTDTLQGPDSYTDWQITGYKSGGYAPVNWNPTTTFNSIENLQGGSSTDTFIFAPGGTITGRIDGGGGTRDALDYTQFTTTVNVDLRYGSATRVNGGVQGIEDVRGGAAGDYLRGNELSNRLEGNGGNDWLYGYGGSDTLKGGNDHDHLYGGDDVDWLYGDSGNDYLDGGDDYARDVMYGGSDRDTIVRHFHEQLVFTTSLTTYDKYSAQPVFYYEPTNIYNTIYQSNTKWVRESQYDDYDSGEDVLISKYWDLFGELDHTWYDYPA